MYVLVAAFYWSYMILILKKTQVTVIYFWLHLFMKWILFFAEFIKVRKERCEFLLDRCVSESQASSSVLVSDMDQSMSVWAQSFDYRKQTANLLMGL